MAELTVPAAALQRAALIELGQRVHLGSDAASIIVEGDGWKVAGGLAGCHQRRGSADAVANVH